MAEVQKEVTELGDRQKGQEDRRTETKEKHDDFKTETADWQKEQDGQLASIMDSINMLEMTDGYIADDIHAHTTLTGGSIIVALLIIVIVIVCICTKYGSLQETVNNVIRMVTP